MKYDDEYEEKFRAWKIDQPEGTASLSGPVEEEQEDYFDKLRREADEDDDDADLPDELAGDCICLGPRPKKEVYAEIADLWDRIWYHRHRNMLCAIAEGHDVCDPATLDRAQKNAQRLEEEYGGRENLSLSELDYAFLCGKMSALRWAMGEDWDGSLDT
jgi:hypothetical protein